MPSIATVISFRPRFSIEHVPIARFRFMASVKADDSGWAHSLYPACIHRLSTPRRAVPRLEACRCSAVTLAVAVGVDTISFFHSTHHFASWGIPPFRAFTFRVRRSRLDRHPRLSSFVPPVPFVLLRPSSLHSFATLTFPFLSIPFY